MKLVRLPWSGQNSRVGLIALLLAGLALAVGACQNGDGGGIRNPIPEIRSSQGPTGIVSLYQPDVTTRAEVDVKGFANTAVFLRIARGEDDLDSIRAQDISNACQTPAATPSIRTCSFTFPTAERLNPSQQRPADRRPGDVFYRWNVEYWLPGSTPQDAATVRGPVSQFTVASTCRNAADCTGTLACRRDPFSPPAQTRCPQVFGVELPILCQDDGGLGPLLCLPPT
jgi:hypothetical protein